MPAPIITNPYDNDTPLSAYVGEPFSAKIAIANTPTRLNVTGNWIRWGYRWLSAENSVELLITPKGLRKELLITDEDTGKVLETSGIRLEAINTDGSDLEMIPFEFIHREPIIDDIPIQEFTRGQKGVDYNIRIRHNPNVIAVVGDLLGLDHEARGEGVRIFGDIVDGDLTKPSGTYTVDAANGTGAAPQKEGKWGIPGRPYQPTGVTIIAQDRGVRVAWDEILSYPTLNRTQIRRATSENALRSASWTTLSDANATEHTYTGLNNGTTYFAQVRGRNTRGYGPASAAISGTPQAIPAVPAAPTNVSVVGRNTSLIVSWRIPYVFPAVSKIQIRWATSQAGLTSATWTDLAKDATTHTITRLTNATRYFVQVRLVNSEGNGAASAAISGTPNPIPVAPAASTGVTATAAHKSIVVKWTLPVAFPALSKQQIRWATTTTALASASWTDLAKDATTHTIPNLTNGTTTFAQVRGVNSEGNGATSATVSATPAGIPDAPSGVSAAGSNAEVVVKWTIGHAFPALSKQQIRWATTTTALASATWTDVAKDATSHTIPNLVNGTQVYAQVRGVNSQGNGTVSATVSATPMAISGAPGTPTDLTITAVGTGNQIKVTWTPGTNSHPSTIYEMQFLRFAGTGDRPSFPRVTGVTEYTTPNLNPRPVAGYRVRIRAINVGGGEEMASAWTRFSGNVIVR